MADIKQDHKGEDVDSYGMGNSADPKNMQELTQYVSGVYDARDDHEDASLRCVDGSDAGMTGAYSFAGTDTAAEDAGQVPNDVGSDHREKYPFANLASSLKKVGRM